jgi:hypothetical protein
MGTLLYHGAQSADSPPGPEWMAFEVEHAEAFAFSSKRERGKHGGQNDDDTRLSSSAQKIITHPTQQPKDNTSYIRGYLHTYRAHRDLNLLYVDGMSAGKSFMGTLDTQDLVLRENHTSEHWGSFMDEPVRAMSICNILTEWGYDGLMRMEMGFEVIYCDFTKGVDKVMMTRSAIHDDRLFETNMNPFQWTRAAAERYEGIGGDRARLDFSSMVSAYFFPVNISNPDPARPDLHRLVSASHADLKDIKIYLGRILKAPRRYTVNWQAVVDMIVARYSHRLALLASRDQSFDLFSDELEIATQTYINAPPLPGDISLGTTPPVNRTADALQACGRHYLLSVYIGRDSWSLEDQLIHTAVHKVTSHICETLFAARAIMTEYDEDLNFQIVKKSNKDDKTPAKVAAARKLFEELKDDLAWPSWRKPQLCAEDEVLLTVMWPIGNKDDYWNPACRKHHQVRFARQGYWVPAFKV